MAELILQMQRMARERDLTTLAGILELAHAEARLRMKDAV
jgi:hypothetical protein